MTPTAAHPMSPRPPRAPLATLLLAPPAAPARHDLREALDAVLDGKDVAVPLTDVDGCPITRPEPPPARAVTFAKDVAPILKRNCQECHRPGTVAPFALQTYEQVTGRAKAVAE